MVPELAPLRSALERLHGGARAPTPRERGPLVARLLRVLAVHHAAGRGWIPPDALPSAPDDWPAFGAALAAQGWGRLVGGALDEPVLGASGPRAAVFAELRSLFDRWRLSAEDVARLFERAAFAVESGAEAVRRRKRAGAFHTPPRVVADVARVALGTARPASPRRVRIGDPACGAGLLLLAAGRRLAELSEGSARPSELMGTALRGVDRDPLSVEAAKLVLWWASDDPGRRPGDWDRAIVVGDALAPPERGGVDWPAAFPEVFDQGGFDVVVANPPFVNAIEHADLRSDEDRAHYRAQLPRFAKGAFDLSVLFFGRILQDLLREGGGYGVVLPTSVLAGPSAWRPWVQRAWAPTALVFHPVEAFPEARVRTTVVARGPGDRSGRVEVQTRDPRVELEQAAIRRWPEAVVDNWYAFALGPREDRGAVALGDVAEVRAGCTAGAAYRLRDELGGRPEPGLRLVTTGAIDRHRCRWGERPLRFLGADRERPRWPLRPLNAELARAARRQSGPKILVAGLTAVLEAWFDARGEAGGVVQTWVLRPKADPSEAWFWWTTGVLNAACLSRQLVTRFGAHAMTGRQITIRKASLQALRIPRWGGGAPERGASLLELGRDERLPPELEATADALIARSARAMAEGDAERREGADQLAHLLVGLRMGGTRAEAEDDYRWWCARVRQPARLRPWPDLIASGP